MKYPDFSYEASQDYDFVIGVDEVGRGCLAGPLVVSAVAFPKNFHKKKGGLVLDCAGKLLTINDSKKLKPKERELLSLEIKKIAVCETAEISVGTINKIGIAKATAKGMRKTIKDVCRKIDLASFSHLSYLGDLSNLEPEESKKHYVENPKNQDKTVAKNTRRVYVLSDYFTISYLPQIGSKNQKGIIKGDQVSVSIASASIIAKVYRDQVMLRLGDKQRYKKYGWGVNKGYGTKDHIEALKKHGSTKYHRKLFVRNFVGSR